MSTNPRNLPLKELLEIANKQELQIILIGEDASPEDLRRAAQEQLDSQSKVMIINAKDLLPEDQRRIEAAQRIHAQAEPMYIKAPSPLPDYTVPQILEESTKPWYHSLPDKRRKKHR